MRMYDRTTLGQGGRTCKQWVSGVQKHKGVQKAAYSMLTAYLRSRIKTRHLRIEDRVKAVLLAM